MKQNTFTLLHYTTDYMMLSNAAMHVYHVIILSLAELGPVKIVMSCEFENSQDIVSCEASGLFAITGLLIEDLR